MRKFPLLWWVVLFALVSAFCLLLAGGRVRGIALNTVLLSLAAASIAVPVGTLVAMVLTKTNCPGRQWWTAAFAVLLFVPLYLHAAGWQAAVGVGGWMTVDPVTGLAKPWLDGWRGAIWIHAMAAVPWVVCMVAAGLARVPAAMEEAASLVASPCRVLWSITLPAVRPAIAIATVWTMVSVAAEMTVTDFFQIRTFAEEVYTTAAAGGFQTDNPAADYAAWVPWTRNLGLMAGVGLLASLSLLVLLPVVHQLKTAADVPAQRAWRWECRGWRRWLAMLVPMSVLLLAAGMPIASLVHKAGWGAQASGTGWQRAWSLTKLQSELAGAVGLHARELWQTLVLAIAVATGAMVLGLVIGWHLRTSRRTPIVTIVGLALALAIPGPLVSLVVIDLLNHPLDSPAALLTRAYDQTLLAPWLVQMIRITPWAALVIAAGFARVPNVLIDAAKADGAGTWQTLRRVGLPTNVWMVTAAWLLAAALSAGELAATVLVMPPGPPTLTIRLFSLLHYGVEDRVAAISLVFLAGIATVAVIAVRLVGNGRRQPGGVI